VTGRPSSYRPEFVTQAEKLCRLGATDAELADFFAKPRTEDDFLAACLTVIRQDRRGIFAARKSTRNALRARIGRSSPSRRLENSMRSRMYAALKGRTSGSCLSRLGYSKKQLLDHLESLFQPGMTWENYGKWHVDHIVPCASFDHLDPVQFERCWALGNLQPLWAADNVKKGARNGAP